MAKYSHHKFPPAPVLSVRLSQPTQPPQAQLKLALIDTGGDFTTVPLNWLLEIDASEVRMAYLRGLWSEQRLVTLFSYDLIAKNDHPN